MKQFSCDSKHLQHAVWGCTLGTLLCVAGAVGACVLAATQPTLQRGLLCLIPALLLAVLTPVFWRRRSILRSGILGERTAAQAVRRLPASYRAVSSVRLRTKDGRRCEMDFVVIGPNGVFVVENKHHRGRITGSVQDAHWRQEKQGRGGAAYQAQFYNPVKQVSTHVHHLAQALRAHGFDVWVQSAVYFSHPETQLALRGLAGCGTPVLCAAQDDLSAVLRAMPAKTPLTERQRQAIYDLLRSGSLR